MRQAADDIGPPRLPVSSVAKPAADSFEPVTLETLRPRFPGPVDQAIATFGSPTKAIDWLTARCGALDDQIPLDLLIRGDVEAVETELGRIEYGIYV